MTGSVKPKPSKYLSKAFAVKKVKRPRQSRGKHFQKETIERQLRGEY